MNDWQQNNGGFQQGGGQQGGAQQGGSGYQSNPGDWEDIASREIPNPAKEGTGIRVRTYRKISEGTPRMGISEYYTDKDGKMKFGKAIRIPMESISQFAQAMNEVVKAAMPAQ